MVHRIDVSTPIADAVATSQLDDVQKCESSLAFTTIVAYVHNIRLQQAGGFIVGYNWRYNITQHVIVNY